MGLDQYLFRADSADQEEKEEVAYWRKSNQIHAWIVDNCNGGDDDVNCQMIEVNLEQLAGLVKTCKEIIAEQPCYQKAEELLPTRSGFFFGGTEYDEWYYRDLEETVKMLEPIIANPKDTRKVFYWAWY